MSAKRTAARALLCPEWFGELRVHRSPPRGRTRVPAEQRVRFFRRLHSTPACRSIPGRRLITPRLTTPSNRR